MKKQIFTMKVLNVFLAFALALSGVATLVSIEPVQAAPGDNPDGALRIEIQSAYNLVVDSNVSSPPTYAPTSFSVGAKVCNDGTTDLNDVVVNIGTYTNTTTYQAGVYPSRYHNDSTGFSTQHPHLNNPAGAGTYQFKHEGGSAGAADATRYIGAIPAGECRTHYWLLSYPQCENNADGTFHAAPCGSLEPVWGRTNDPNDDLWLEYDIWATSGSFLARQRHRMTMRNEISAMANKIWPNGDNKVPDAYRQAIQDAFGWDTIPPEGSSLVSYPGQRVITTQGIWYDFGNVNQGFDNDGDLVPDYNAWVQPIGDPSSFDPGCFRLIKAYGLLVVKRQGQQELLIPFEDQLYFQNLPPDNTGVVGLVYYQYVAIDGACTAGLSPYQEVASGSDNEKFNADFGTGIPPLTSQALPDGAIDKTADPVLGLTVPGGTITYTITFTNPTDVSLGLPEAGLPIVIRDSIPEGTTYVAGSAAAGNTLPSGVTAYTVHYSTNDGVTWTTTEPAASSVTDLQWWLSNDLQSGASGTVTFTVTADSGSGPVYYNVAGIGLGNAASFDTDDAVTYAAGTGIISGTVFEDNGASFRDGVYQSADEDPIPGVTVTLYISTTNGYVLWGSMLSDATDGSYLFDELPAGDYKIVVSTDLPSNEHIGWTESTDTSIDVTLAAGGTSSGNNFGFAPSLKLTKTLVENGGYENDTVSYVINVTNLLPGGGETVGNTCHYEIWSQTGSTAASPKDFTDYTDAFGEPDDNYAYGDFSIGAGRWIEGTGFDATSIQGTINQVNMMLRVYVDPSPPDDYAVAELQGTTAISYATFTNAELTSLAGLANAGYLTRTIPASNAPGGSWDTSDFAGFTLRFTPEKTGGADDSNLYIDAIGFRIIVDGACEALDSSDVIATVPLTDTFDADLLTFVSASPAESDITINGSTGAISWANIGPIFPGQTKSIAVNFLAKEPVPGPTATIDNVAATTDPRFADGRLANSDTYTATGTITATAEITGVVFSDPNSSGWAYTPASDLGIPNVTVELLACVDSTTGALIDSPVGNQDCAGEGGIWDVVDTVTTDADGLYEFVNVRPAYYRVRVAGNTLPASSFTQTGEAGVTYRQGSNYWEQQDMTGDQANGRDCPDPNNACDGIWGGASRNLNTTNYNPIQSTNVNEVIGGVNFGYNIPAAVYGTIWQDHNGDGTRDTGDDGLDNSLGGITVTLRDSSNTIITTTQTDANGYYQFIDLAAGTYTITVDTTTLPYAGDPNVQWTNTSDTGPGTDNGDTDSVLGTVTLTSGQVSGSYDFGYAIDSGPYSLSGTVYADWNNSASLQESSEPGFEGITVTLYSTNGTVITTTRTDANGVYTFTDLITGTYTVIVDYEALPPGYSPTEDPDENGLCSTCNHRTSVTVDESTDPVTDVDFGYKPVGSGQIGDLVWIDLNGNGEPDGVRETGIEGVTVTLQIDLNGDGNWTTVMTQTTNANGNYLFENLPDGSYRVIVDTTAENIPEGPGGFTYVPSTLTTQTATMSGGSVTAINGSACTDCDLDVDFGFKPLAAVGDTVYYDANGNGEQDWNETGIPGAEVRLYNNTGQTVVINGVTVANGAYITTATNSDPNNGYPIGWYQFSGLETGSAGNPYTYTVQVITSTLPNGTVLAQTADPDRDGVACDDNTYPDMPACDHATTVKVYPGTNFMGADFGYQPLGVVGDYVWLDFDNDGIQDVTEVGIPGVVVTITPPITVNLGAGLGNPITTTTDFDGYYSFVNLPDATYTVAFQTPSGMTSVGDVNQSVGTSTTVTVSSGVGSMNIDSGFRYAGTNTLRGTICMDSSTPDGQCGIAAATSGYTTSITTGEMTFTAGIPVYAYLCTENPAGTVTGCDLVGVTSIDNDGDYTFTGLPAASHDGSTGTYYAVSMAVPFSGLALTTNDTNDDIRNGSNTQIGTTDVVTTTSLSSGYLVSAYQTIKGDFSGSGSVIQNVDFAYRSNVSYDFGDLPSTYDDITLLANNGARHTTGDLYFGTGVTNESEAKTDPAADQDEEQGVVFNPNNWELGGQGVITVTVHGESGYLVAWIDWDGNGDFLGTGELITRSAVVTGTNVLTFSIPTAATTDPLIFMRIRLFSEAPLVPELSYVGLATNGEVQDKSFDNPFNPTAITLASFEATPQDEAILVTWETAMELDNVGFNLYRSTAAAGPYTLLNATLIPPENPGSVMGGYYEWLDTDVQPGVVYYYKLEDLDVKGVSTLHGPISISISTAPTAVKLQRVSARSAIMPLALGLMMLLGLVVVFRQRRLT